MRSTRVTCLLAAAVMGLFFFAAGLSRAVGSGADSSYVEAMQSWKAKRLERLKSPDGYLAIVGLAWLHAGSNTFGSDSTNDVVLPDASCPAHMGTFTLADGRVTVQVAAGAGVTHDGTAVTDATLADDTSDNGPTVLEHGRLSWYVIKRSDKFGIRIKDPESPTLRAFHGVESYPVDKRWRIRGTFEPYNPVKTIAIASVGDFVTQEVSSGAVSFVVDGKRYRLDVLASPGDETLFVIFADQTNGRETYGAGRFLVVDAPARGDSVWIDFNKAYDPPCAFSEYTTCPLPPAQNRLPFRVTAGEKVYQPTAH